MNKKTKKNKTNFSRKPNKKHSNKKISNKKKLKQQIGGTLLGEGGFGCVVTPPLGCKNKKLSKFKNKDYVSKIVDISTYDTLEDAMSEIEIGNLLKRIDKTGKYFTPIIDYCKLKKTVRKDTIKIEWINKSEYYVIDDKYPKIPQEDKCKLDTKLEYMNLIMVNSGINIKQVAKMAKNTIEYQYLKNNIRSIMKHLCEGLQKLKTYGIVHCDIKEANITFKMINNNKAKISIIDYGLADHIDDENYINYTFENLVDITSRGTEGYMPPEIVLIHTMLQYHLYYLNGHSSQSLSSKKLRKKILESSSKYFIDRKITDFFKKLNLYKGGISLAQSLKSKSLSSSSKSKKTMLRDFYNPNKDGILIYNKLLKYVNNKKIIDKMYEINGILDKWSVYSLGFVFTYLTNKKLNYHNEQCIDLINNMINIDFEKRFNIDQCLTHPFFKD